MEKQQDIRVIKSKRDLCAALVELMQTTPFKKITVGDICAKAMINKMTFYKHYADKYELLSDVLLNIKQSILDRTEKAKPYDGVEDSALNFIFRLLDAVLDECLLRKKILLELSNDDLVLTIISTTIEKSVYEVLSNINRQHPFYNSLDAVAAGVTGATTFLIRYWLVREPEISKEKFLEGTKKFLSGLFSSKILFN